MDTVDQNDSNDSAASNGFQTSFESFLHQSMPKFSIPLKKLTPDEIAMHTHQDESSRLDNVDEENGTHDINIESTGVIEEPATNFDEDKPLDLSSTRGVDVSSDKLNVKVDMKQEMLPDETVKIEPNDASAHKDSRNVSYESDGDVICLDDLDDSISVFSISSDEGDENRDPQNVSLHAKEMQVLMMSRALK